MKKIFLFVIVTFLFVNVNASSLATNCTYTMGNDKISFDFIPAEKNKVSNFTVNGQSVDSGDNKSMVYDKTKVLGSDVSNAGCPYLAYYKTEAFYPCYFLFDDEDAEKKY